MTTTVSNNTYAQAGLEEELKRQVLIQSQAFTQKSNGWTENISFLFLFTKDQRQGFQECGTMASWEVLEEASTLTTILKIAS